MFDEMKKEFKSNVREVCKMYKHGEITGWTFVGPIFVAVGLYVTIVIITTVL